MVSKRASSLELMARKLASRLPLDAADREAILALPHDEKRIERGAYLIREGDPARKACVILSGFAVRSKQVRDGARQIVSIQMRGDLVDLQNALLQEADHSVEMLTNGSIAEIDREDILRIAEERPMVGRAMWMDTLIDGSIFREWVTNVGRRDARTRIAHVVCEFALRLKLAGLGDYGRYDMPMTQEQLADATGLTAVHVNRTIRGLEAEGLIARDGPRCIRIVNWDKLAEVADFESRYLHLHKDDAVSA